MNTVEIHLNYALGEMFGAFLEKEVSYVSEFKNELNFAAV
jgi:hypothetical protein